MTQKPSVVVAMSGGVDSTLAAALLKEAGHPVIGVTLRLLKTTLGMGCCGSTRDVEDAREVAGLLQIPHYVWDFSQSFQDKVVRPFAETYRQGATPNPCIECNRHIKFSALLERAAGLGADFIATGHYARIVTVSTPGGERRRLAMARDKKKDQSYVLYPLGPEELAKVLFPLGELTKPEVRALTRRRGLPTAEKSESMEICFVPEADTALYLHSVLGQDSTAQPGRILNTAGQQLGTHRGALYYTVGQREGLGLSLGSPAYVLEINTDANTLVVGTQAETFSNTCEVESLHWTMSPPPPVTFSARVKIRSHHEAAPAKVTWREDRATIRFDEPQRALTPGQSAVFYDGEMVMGGGPLRRKS